MLTNCTISPVWAATMATQTWTSHDINIWHLYTSLFMFVMTLTEATSTTVCNLYCPWACTLSLVVCGCTEQTFALCVSSSFQVSFSQMLHFCSSLACYQLNPNAWGHSILWNIMHSFEICGMWPQAGKHTHVRVQCSPTNVSSSQLIGHVL